jgi:hypothetical protein
MANITFDQVENLKKSGSTSTKGKDYKVSYFTSLKDDGDEAIVRFAYSTAEDFNEDLFSVHNVKTKNKDGKDVYRTVSCLKENLNSPKSQCPLCLTGKNNPVIKFFVKVIEYVKDENGQITPKARIWPRPSGFVKQLRPFTFNGDLSNMIFKVTRNGEKGNMKTEYDIEPTRPDVYKSEIYVKKLSDFEGFKLQGSIFLSVLTYQEMDTFIKTGSFPVIENKQTQPMPSTYPTHEVSETTPSPRVVEEDKPKPSNPTEGRPQRYTF